MEAICGKALEFNPPLCVPLPAPILKGRNERFRVDTPTEHVLIASSGNY